MDDYHKKILSYKTLRTAIYPSHKNYLLSLNFPEPSPEEIEYYREKYFHEETKDEKEF